MTLTKFNIDDFFNSATTLETQRFAHGDYEFDLRRLNGRERAQYNAIVDDEYRRRVYVLSRCVLTGDAQVPIGEKGANDLIERFDVLSELLFNDVFELTRKSLDKENEIWDKIKKNSKTAKRTSTKSSEDNIGAGTV